MSPNTNTAVRRLILILPLPWEPLDCRHLGEFILTRAAARGFCVCETDNRNFVFACDIVLQYVDPVARRIKIFQNKDDEETEKTLLPRFHEL